MKEPQDKEVKHPLAGVRRPDYVIVTWVAAELRDRIQRNGPLWQRSCRSRRGRLLSWLIQGWKAVRQGSDHRPETGAHPARCAGGAGARSGRAVPPEG
jgi:hypothetical protein